MRSYKRQPSRRRHADGELGDGAGARHGRDQPRQTIAYTPAANYDGADSFNYTIADGNSGTATETVNVTVTAANDGPAAVNDTLTLAEDTAATIAVLADDTDLDGDTLTVSR